MMHNTFVVSVCEERFQHVIMFAAIACLACTLEVVVSNQVRLHLMSVCLRPMLISKPFHASVPGSLLGLQLALRCSVDAISFSAHADFPQTSDFLDLVNPPHVVLVHGEAGEMMRLKRALEQRAKATDRLRNLYTPKVTQPVHIRHQPRHIAKVR